MQNEAIRDELLKVDRRGRVRVSAKRREALLDEFERCGVSAAEFSKAIGVRYQTFTLKADYFTDFIARTKQNLIERLCFALNALMDDTQKVASQCAIRK